VIKHMPNKCEALNSILLTTHPQKNAHKRILDQYQEIQSAMTWTDFKSTLQSERSQKQVTAQETILLLYRRQRLKGFIHNLHQDTQPRLGRIPSSTGQRDCLGLGWELRFTKKEQGLFGMRENFWVCTVVTVTLSNAATRKTFWFQAESKSQLQYAKPSAQSS
jgi:hypothetical protein